MSDKKNGQSGTAGPVSRVFVTTSGREIAVEPVSQVQIERLRMSIINRHLESGKPIKTPLYEVKGAFDEVEKFPHTAETIKTAPPEEKKVWQEHLDAVGAMELEIQQAVTKYMLLEGLVGLDVPPEWVKKQQYYGFTLPDDPMEVKLSYLVTDVLKTFEDQTNCIARIMRVSAAGLDPEVLDAAEASFRSAVATESKRRARQAISILEAQAGQVAAQSPTVNPAHPSNLERSETE